MEGWKERLIQEQKDLGEKIVKLSAYLKEPKSCENIQQRDLMVIQLHAMVTYDKILDARIQLFL